MITFDDFEKSLTHGCLKQSNGKITIFVHESRSD